MTYLLTASFWLGGKNNEACGPMLDFHVLEELTCAVNVHACVCSACMPVCSIPGLSQPERERFRDGEEWLCPLSWMHLPHQSQHSTLGRRGQDFNSMADFCRNRSGRIHLGDKMYRDLMLPTSASADCRTDPHLGSALDDLHLLLSP